MAINVFFASEFTVLVLMQDAVLISGECRNMARNLVKFIKKSDTEVNGIQLDNPRNIEAFSVLFQAVMNCQNEELNFHIAAMQVLFFITVSSAVTVIYQTIFTVFVMERWILLFLFDGISVFLAMMVVLRRVAICEKTLRVDCAQVSSLPSCRGG